MATFKNWRPHNDNKKPEPPVGDPAAAIKHDESKKSSVLLSMIIHFSD
jgi:hypothetical protein